jgi:cobalt-zinc-cadmium efflux system membrane fusion protein
MRAPRPACAVLLVGLALAAACGGDEPPPAAVVPAPTAPPAEPPAPAAPALAPRTLPPVVAVTAEAAAEVVPDADGDVVIATPTRARVVELHVRPGDVVAVGAPLLTVTLPELAIEAARAAGASDQLAALATRRDAVATLLAEGLARAGDLAELDARAAQLRAERGVALAAVRAGGPGAATHGGRITLTSPIAGVVTEVAARAGALHGPGDGPLARVARGTGSRVVARFAAMPAPGVARLWLPDGASRDLAATATAPAEVGVVAWYDVAGPPLATTTRARVRIEATP